MRWQVTMALAGGLALAACGGQPASPGASFSVGSTGATYALAAVEGKALPANAYFGVDVSVNATAGKLTLGSDHSYALSVDYHRHFASGNRDVPFTLAEEGTWSASGNALTLTPSGGGSAHTATVAGTQLAMVLSLAEASPAERGAKTYTFAHTP